MNSSEFLSSAISQEVLLRALHSYGERKQLRKLAQECLELALAIDRMLEGRDSWEHFFEEAADVSIVISQFLLDADNKIAFDDFVIKKVIRLSERLDEREAFER